MLIASFASRAMAVDGCCDSVCKQGLPSRQVRPSLGFTSEGCRPPGLWSVMTSRTKGENHDSSCCNDIGDAEAVKQTAAGSHDSHTLEFGEALKVFAEQGLHSSAIFRKPSGHGLQSVMNSEPNLLKVENGQGVQWLAAALPL